MAKRLTCSKCGKDCGIVEKGRIRTGIVVTCGECAEKGRGEDLFNTLFGGKR